MRGAGSSLYQTYDSTFSLNFGDPRGIMNWIGYSSTMREWRAWH